MCLQRLAFKKKKNQVQNQRCQRSFYLPVDKAHDGCLDSHAHSEAGVHVLVVKEGLHAGEEEHERGVEISFPQWSILFPHKAQQQTERIKTGRTHDRG